MEYFELPKGEPKIKAIKAMQLYIESGCVTEKYLNDVLGDQGKGVHVYPRESENLERAVA